MGFLLNQIGRLLNWFKKRHTNKWGKIEAFEVCLQDGLDKLAANTTQFAVDLDGTRINVWFPIDEAIISRIRHQVMLEFRDDLRISVGSFWVRNAALPIAFDCVLHILNDNEYYGVDRRLTKRFYTALCNKHCAMVKDDMGKRGLLT